MVADFAFRDFSLAATLAGGWTSSSASSAFRFRGILFGKTNYLYIFSKNEVDVDKGSGECFCFA
jgi:hypothetical protein